MNLETKLRKVMVDHGFIPVGDYSYEVCETTNKNKLVVLVKHKYLDEQVKIRVDKFDLGKDLGLDTLILNGQHANSYSALKEINAKYDLRLTEDDIEPVAIRDNKYLLEITNIKSHYTGSINVQCIRESDDIVAMFNNQLEVLAERKHFENAKYIARHLEFVYLKEQLSGLQTGDSLSEELQKHLLHKLFSVGFTSSKEPAKRNLMGCIVIKNGEIQNAFTKGTNKISLGLNKRLSTELKGVLELYY